MFSLEKGRIVDSAKVVHPTTSDKPRLCLILLKTRMINIQEGPSHGKMVYSLTIIQEFAFYSFIASKKGAENNLKEFVDLF